MGSSPWSRHRLRSGDDFRAITRRGVRSGRSHVVVHLARLPQPGREPRVGFVVSTKVGNSVIRHRLTRRFREIVRRHLDHFPERSQTVIRAVPGAAELPFADLERQLLAALDSASRKLSARAEHGAAPHSGAGPTR